MDYVERVLAVIGAVCVVMCVMGWVVLVLVNWAGGEDEDAW